VGLALLLVSLIPSGQLGSSTSGGQFVTATGIGWWDFELRGLSAQPTLTPQQTLHITLNITGAVNVTLIDTTLQAILNWINNIHGNMSDWWNITYFDEFVKSNPTMIVWQREVDNGTLDYDYVPTDVVSVDQLNMSLVVSNDGSNPAGVQYTGSVESGVAPTVKVRTLSEFAIPIGVALTLPWLNELARARRKFQRAHP
jgi:hypothetical protein